jgi:sec-independent protein translocase protein TatA
MFGIGPPELIVIFLIILILFGAKRLPELARSLGRSINEFKNASQSIKEDLEINQNDSSSEKESKDTKGLDNSDKEKKQKDDIAG